MSIYKTYEEKTSAIRKKFRDFEEVTKNDKSRTEEYKKCVIGEAKAKATEGMKALRAEYFAAKEQEKKDAIRQAFECRGDESAYLGVMAQADSMDNARRQRAASNALSIGASDHIRAIAHSAYNSGDRLTLNYIGENADNSITEPINKLLGGSDGLSRSQEIKWEMFTFVV